MDIWAFPENGLQIKHLTKEIVGAIRFVRLHKTITLQSKILGMLSCKQGHITGSNIIMKSCGGICFVMPCGQIC